MLLVLIKLSKVRHLLPWYSHEDEATEELNDVLHKEYDKDEPSCEDQGSNHSLPISKAIGQPTIKHQTKDLTAESSIRKTRLPGSRQIVLAIRKTSTESFLECWHGEQVGYQDEIKALHCNSKLAN